MEVLSGLYQDRAQFFDWDEEKASHSIFKHNDPLECEFVGQLGAHQHSLISYRLED